MKKRRTLEEVKQLVNDGDIHAFYVSREWKDKRIEILNRDHYECQRCKGNYVVESKPIKRIKIKRAKYVHHIIPMKDCFELALDDDNLVSLCFECHEIVEGRDGTWKKFKYKKKLTKKCGNSVYPPSNSHANLKHGERACGPNFSEIFARA